MKLTTADHGAALIKKYSIMVKVLYGWHFARITRVLLGGLIIWRAVVSADWAIAIIGILLVVFAIANVGCCTTAGNTRHKGHTMPGNLAGDIEFEEVR